MLPDISPTTAKATVPCYISTFTLPLRAMLIVSLLAVHPVACLLMLAYMIITMKALRLTCIIIYTPAVHLPHPAVEKVIQVSWRVARAGLTV